MWGKTISYQLLLEVKPLEPIEPTKIWLIVVEINWWRLLFMISWFVGLAVGYQYHEWTLLNDHNWWVIQSLPQLRKRHGATGLEEFEAKGYLASSKMGGCLENVLNLAEHFFFGIKTIVNDFLWEQTCATCFVEWKLGHSCYVKLCNIWSLVGKGLMLLLGGRVSTQQIDRLGPILPFICWRPQHVPI